MPVVDFVTFVITGVVGSENIRTFMISKRLRQFEIRLKWPQYEIDIQTRQCPLSDMHVNVHINSWLEQNTNFTFVFNIAIAICEKRTFTL